MPIVGNCRSCGTRFKVSDAARGKELKCKECGEAIRVPKPKRVGGDPEAHRGLDKEVSERVRPSVRKRRKPSDGKAKRKRRRRPAAESSFNVCPKCGKFFEGRAVRRCFACGYDSMQALDERATLLVAAVGAVLGSAIGALHFAGWVPWEHSETNNTIAGVIFAVGFVCAIFLFLWLPVFGLAKLEKENPRLAHFIREAFVRIVKQGFLWTVSCLIYVIVRVLNGRFPIIASAIWVSGMSGIIIYHLLAAYSESYSEE